MYECMLGARTDLAITDTLPSLRAKEYDHFETSSYANRETEINKHWQFLYGRDSLTVQCFLLRGFGHKEAKDYTNTHMYAHTHTHTHTPMQNRYACKHHTVTVTSLYEHNQLEELCKSVQPSGASARQPDVYDAIAPTRSKASRCGVRLIKIQKKNSYLFFTLGSL